MIGAGGEGSAAKLIERLQVALDARGVSLLVPGPGKVETMAAAGCDPPGEPDHEDARKAGSADEVRVLERPHVRVIGAIRFAQDVLEGDPVYLKVGGE